MARQIGKLYRYSQSKKTGSKTRHVNIGKLDSGTARRVQEDADTRGIKLKESVEGYNVLLSSNAVRHSLSRHRLTEQDIQLVPEVIKAPDSIKVETKKGRIRVIFRKKINGSLVAVETVGAKKRQLTTTTIWKKEGTGRVMPSEEGPPDTSETGLRPPTETIPPPKPEVKPEGPGQISQADIAELRRGGYTKAQIAKLTPEEAEHILRLGIPASEYRAELGELREGNIFGRMRAQGISKIRITPFLKQLASKKEEFTRLIRSRPGLFTKRETAPAIDEVADSLGMSPQAVVDAIMAGSKPGFGLAYDVGGYARARRGPLHGMELPEIVELAREINAGKLPKVVEKLRTAGAVGQFSPKKGEIKIKAELLKDTAEAQRVLAHEIGHLVDWLPEKTMARGNILGRLASLKKYMKASLKDISSADAVA